MSDPSDQPTRESEPPHDPLRDETRDAPVPPDPGTRSALTHTGAGEPHTVSHSETGGPREPIVEPPGFAILRELGRGGMGVVYEARQVKLNRLVALKVLRGRGTAQEVLRFLAEAEAVAAIKHPHVVQVYEFGQNASGPYMALELLTGGTLSERLARDGRFAPRDAAALVAKLADAVQAAHDLGIIHRDLKPGNILFQVESQKVEGRKVEEPGASDVMTLRPADLRPVVTDFGLAKRGGADLTRTQAVMGTPAYMAPEQARGEARFVGPAADVWALGVILYECLTGKRAFEADDTWAILRKVTDDAPPAPRTHVPGLPRDLELIALKCLEKNPADRYPTAAALAADLENYLAGRPVTVRPAGPLERAVKWTKRNKLEAAAATAVFLALVIGSAVSLAFGIQAARRGAEVAKANDDLTRTNDALTTSRDELKESRDDLSMTADALKGALDVVRKTADVLKDANAVAEERGYLSDIALAHQMWRANDLLGMRGALERCPPGRRRWEWRYLNGLARPEREAIPTDSVALALEYSPDGTRLAFLTAGGALTVRDLRPGWEGRNWYQFESREPFGFTVALAFRPDGKELAFAIGPRTWVLDLETRQAKELTPRKKDDTLVYPTVKFIALGYAGAGRLLGAHTKDGAREKEFAFVLRDVAADKTVATLVTDAKLPLNGFLTVGGAAFSPDGARFAAAVVDSGIFISSDGKDGKRETFSPVLNVWQIDTGALVRSAPCGAALLQQLAFEPEGRAVAFGRGGQAGELGQTPRHFTGHAGEVRAVAIDANGLLWSAGEDKFLVARDRRTGAERFVVRGCPTGVVRLVVSPNGKEVAAAVGDLLGGPAAVYRFDVAARGADVWRAPAGANRISTIAALAPDGAKFAACEFDPSAGPAGARLVLRDTGAAGERVVALPRPVLHAAFLPSGGLVFMEERAGAALNRRIQWVRLFDADGKPAHEFAVTGDRQRGAAPLLFHSQGQTLAAVECTTSTAKGAARFAVSVRTWDATTGKPGPAVEAQPAGAFPPTARSLMALPVGGTFAPDRRHLAVAFALGWDATAGGRLDHRGLVLVWDLATGAEVFRQVTLDPLRAVAFAPGGGLVAAGGGPTGGVVYGWALDTGERTFVLHGHTRAVLSLAFGPDGRLATGGGDRVVKVWDVASRREILTLDGFAREVTHVAFTADGNNLVAATGMDPYGAANVAGMPIDWPPAEVRVFRGPK